MDDALPAGDFSEWLAAMRRALGGDAPSDVPCDGCTACCTSSQFVHIEPDESATLARIPRRLLFAAPGRAKGHMVLGYDERGHCPMLVDGACSIYEYRPRTCRTYDCRVFPAAGIEVDDDAQREIGRRARRWRFTYPTEADRALHEAVRAVAASLDETASATERAVLAVRVHGRLT